MARTKTTEKERLSQHYAGLEGRMFAMGSDADIDGMIEEERKNTFNNELDKVQEGMERKHAEMVEAQERLDYDIMGAEIKPMGPRVLIMPFKQNPFQKMEVKGGIIVDAGGYSPRTQFNPVKGKDEEQREFVVTGLVVEVGPDTRWLREGDAVFYVKDSAMPVPFLRERLVCVAEQQVLAVVNVGLQERFDAAREVK